MILKIDDLVNRLDASRNSREMADTSAADSLWIKFSDGKIHRTQDFTTPDENQLLQLQLDADDQLLGLEIFPSETVVEGEDKAKNNVCFCFALMVICESRFSTGARCIRLRAWR